MPYFCSTMNFQQFREIFGANGYVSKHDFATSDCSFDKNSLTRWCANGYLVKMRNGFYVFPEFLKNPDFLYFIASRIYSESYVSLYSALIFHGYISSHLQSQVNCVTRQKTKEFRTVIGDFDFRKMKDELHFGFEMMGEAPFRFPMATPEKALLDMFYLFPEYYGTEQSIRRFAIEEKRLFEDWNSMRMFEYLQLFDNKALESRVALFARMYGL